MYRKSDTYETNNGYSGVEGRPIARKLSVGVPPKVSSGWEYGWGVPSPAH